MCNRCRKGGRTCEFSSYISANLNKDDTDVWEPRPSSSSGSLDSPESYPAFDDRGRLLVTDTSSSSSSNDAIHSLVYWSPDSETAGRSLTSLDPPLDDFPSVTNTSTTIPTVFCITEEYRDVSTRFSNVLNIPRSPTAYSPCHLILQFFIKYHQEKIIPAQYFRYCDYSNFFTKTLLAMAENSEVLRTAVVTFSVLVFSVKGHQRVRPLAFYFYSKAIQGLYSILGEAEQDTFTFYTAVATALELASFDVLPHFYPADAKRYVGDAAKCHRHVRGAARIIEHVVNPIKLCMNLIGTNLLEWCHQMEHYVCFLGAYPMILHPSWRETNALVRETIQREKYAHLPEQDRIPILLDYLYPKFYCLIPKLINILSLIPSLKSMRHGERERTAAQLALELRESDESIDDFFELDDVGQVLQPVILNPIDVGSRHVICCPTFPYHPYFFKYPQAAQLQIMAIGMKCYVRAILLPPILAVLDQTENLVELGDGEEYSIQICRMFAGLEGTLSKPDTSYESFLPIAGSMILATTFCPPELRLWLWCKLVHFEELGRRSLDPMRRSLATLWDMPELVSPSLVSNYSATPEILESIQTTLDSLKLDTEECSKSPELEDELLDPVSQGRGLVGLLS